MVITMDTYYDHSVYDQKGIVASIGNNPPVFNIHKINII